jgi:hypothetical protein
LINTSGPPSFLRFKHFISCRYKLLWFYDRRNRLLREPLPWAALKLCCRTEHSLVHSPSCASSTSTISSAMNRSTTPCDAKTDTTLDVQSNAFDEKPSQQPSISSSKSESDDQVANQAQEKDGHVTETDGEVLEPIQSRHPSVKDASKIPNGGLWAWLQVLGGFFLLFNSWYVFSISQASWTWILYQHISGVS